MKHYLLTEEDTMMISITIPLLLVEQTLSKMRAYVPSRGDIIVEVDVLAIDSLWKNDPSMYINPKIAGDDNDERAIKKFINSKKDIMEGKVTIPPIIYLNTYDKVIDIRFQNGRNRFSNLRDSGVRTMPVAISKSQLSKFKKLNLIV